TLIVPLCGCGNDVLVPLPTIPSRWSLSGTVRVNGVPLAGAAVQILDGPNKDAGVGTDASGHYVFTRLEQAGFTARAFAPGYTSSDKPVNLTSNQTVDFDLTKILAANLQSTGESPDVQVQANGTFTLVISATNGGDGCAGSISGRTAVVNGA